MSNIKVSVSLKSMQLETKLEETVVTSTYVVTGGRPNLQEQLEITVRAQVNDARHAVNASEIALLQIAEAIHSAAREQAERT